LDIQDSGIQVHKEDENTRSKIHSEHCSEGIINMLVVETKNCSDHENDPTECQPVRADLGYDWWTKIRNERIQNSDYERSTLPKRPVMHQQINWAGKWRPYQAVNTTLGSSRGLPMDRGAHDKLSLSYDQVEDTGCNTALTSLDGPDLTVRGVTGSQLFLLKHEQLDSDLVVDQIKNSLTSAVWLEKGYNCDLAANNILMSESHKSFTVPDCTIQLHGKSTSTAVDNSCSTGLVKQKLTNPGFI
jgi:hypothetical protein